MIRAMSWRAWGECLLATALAFLIVLICSVVVP